MPGMAVFPGSGPLRPEGCKRGEGRQRRRVPSGTRAIISLTAPLSFLSLATALSPPPNYHITRRFPSRRPIRRTDAGRSTATGGGYVGDEDLDIGRNLLCRPHRHLVFVRDLKIIFYRKNGGNDPSFSPSYSFCSNMPFSGISDDMHIRSAKTQEEWEDLKKEVAMLKNMQRTQAQVMRAKKQEWEAEKQALEAEKRKLDYDIYDLLQVNFAIKDKLKRIRATCEE
ncbi:hypothetical protein QYE76_069173 [Lolium multiflorum]|uniref:Uncharacterized protein n=1 Tax=Lolium multiflorum TaxID=4521 RepID=A0AAD8SGW4_LOLMU|nr:hypothetical protein QYE76_069173 [Lolium multiflorum]